MNKLLTKLPKIGIRPIIDARMNGVREENEKPTMDYAILLKKIIEKNLHHPSGENVECVISDTTIGRYSEVAKCQEKFSKNNVGVSISITPCWCYGMETIDTTPGIPKAIIGVNGTERPGAVYLAAAAACHEQIGEPVFTIYGKEVKDKEMLEFDKDVLEKILRFAKAGLAQATMKNNAYLGIGGTSMGIAGSQVVPDFINDYLGMRYEVVDMSEVARRIKKNIFDEVEYEKALSWAKKNCLEGDDLNASKNQQTREQKDNSWKDSIKMTLIIRDLMIGNPNISKKWYEESLGHNALVSGFQGQRQWTDYMTNADFSEAILNSTFDWNGIRQPFMVATENDCMNGLSMLLGYLLTGKAQQFSDVRTFWSNEAIKRVTKEDSTGITKKNGGMIHLCNSGSTSLDYTGAQMTKDGKPTVKEHWNVSQKNVTECLKATKWCAGLLEYFRGGGWSSMFITNVNMPVTMSRLAWIKGQGPVLQIAEGWTVKVSDKINEILTKRTNPTWPTSWFVPKILNKNGFKTVYDVMNNWSANHGAISHGHIGADLITLASMLRIPVSFHNVSDDKVFRPKVWGSFGTDNLESADYRACNNYGPLFGKCKK